ncbi:uncharacterized protein LOC131649005 [Vicia villosa]|uniref:uncharacterized protein LOC131649005 n=1 Tax=Vicia villosa TaxID=3911 RepID=UPI00273C1033|nr:uncharacterized protein LOC131649005 [Vicia villosa]
MADQTKFIAEGGSSHRPPLFNGIDYYYWKGKMRLFLLSQDINMWSIIETGNFTPMTAPTDAAPAAPKPQASWTPKEKSHVLLNSKAQFILSCTLSREEYDRIEECNTAKEIWDKLKIHHEGTSHVKEERIDMGVRKFETFEMKEDETIDEMFSRFTIIINELRSLGKIYSPHERIRKLLRCLPKVWRPMVTAITQAKDLTNLPVEELVGSLRAHECIILEDKPQKKGKSIALKTAQNSKETQIKIEESNESPSGDEDDLALISKCIQQMVFRRGQNKRPFRRDPQKAEIDKSKITCYGCNKVGHFKTECPQQKRFVKGTPFKKKSMMPSWDDSENSNSDTNEEEANLCLMTSSESKVSPPISYNLGKFDCKSDKGIFIGYSQTSKGYRIYNLENQCVEETIHVIFNETNEPSTIECLDDELDEQEEILNKEIHVDTMEESLPTPPKGWKTVPHHPHDVIIGETSDQVRTRQFFKDKNNNLAMMSQIEPKHINDAI